MKERNRKQGQTTDMQYCCHITDDVTHDVLLNILPCAEECAYRVLTSDKPDDGKPTGIPIIIKAYELHRDNAEVVEAIVNLIAELSEYGQSYLFSLHEYFSYVGLFKWAGSEGGRGKNCGF